MEMEMEFLRKLPTPQELKEQHPVSAQIVATKAKRDDEIRDIFEGKSDKLILVIGPCSADNEDAVIDYISRLRTVQEKVSDKIFMIPRIYTNKPRTTGIGYKGMLHQPDPERESDMLKGIIAIRHMHMRAVEETGFTCADEMLYPENHRYLSDLLSYVAIGARSVENQQHRLTASGVGIPAGMKNPTGGDISVMMNSIIAAQHGHTFLYRGWEVKTTGNPYAHAILRGYVDKFGRNIPNYHYEDLQNLLEHYEEAREAGHELAHPAVIIDTNHSNSSKQFMEQIRISKDVLHSCKVSGEIRKLVKGLMIESYIEDGAQKVGDGCKGEGMYRILIVEDDEIIARSLKKHLESWDYDVVCVEDFSDVMKEFAGAAPQLVLMDIKLPFYNGYHWCSRIREVSKVPVIFVSSASDNMNIVMAVNMGGDDFIAKPFDLDVLTAKIQALLRRTYDFAGQNTVLEHRGALLNLGDATLTCGETRVDLTKNELKILQVLMENKEKIVSRDTLMTKLWESDSFVDENTLSVNVGRLRKKLDAAGLPDFILTKKGIGYHIG